MLVWTAFVLGDMSTRNPAEMVREKLAVGLSLKGILFSVSQSAVILAEYVLGNMLTRHYENPYLKTLTSKHCEDKLYGRSKNMDCVSKGFEMRVTFSNCVVCDSNSCSCSSCSLNLKPPMPDEQVDERSCVAPNLIL